VPFVPHTPEGNLPGRLVDRGVLQYTIRFNVGREYVMELLERELGPPMGRGEPPVLTLAGPFGDYWQTEEGYWVCFDRGVAWYGPPYVVHDWQAPPGSPTWKPYPDVQPVPKTAALWKKIGRMLIGTDLKPRPRRPGFGELGLDGAGDRVAWIDQETPTGVE
jgi:hypothetical protein